MIRPAVAPAAVLGALLAASPALGLETPPDGIRDKRVRVVEYDRDQVVRLYAAVGATIRIEIAPGETVEAVPVSDQALMSGEVQAELGLGEGSNEPRAAAQPQACAADINLHRCVYGNFIYLKPVRELEPQPLHIQAKRCSVPVEGVAPQCQWRPYQFELMTRLGPLTEAVPNTMFAVRFDYPADRAAAEQAKAAADAARLRAAAQARRVRAAEQAQAAREKAAEDALRAQQAIVRNDAYTVRGDRAVLGAPR